MKAKLVKESLYETNFLGDSQVPVKAPSNRKYPLNAPNYEAEDSEGISDDELNDDEEYLTPDEDEDVEVDDKWEKSEDDDEEVNDLDDIDTSDMENVEDIEVTDDISDDFSIALDNALVFPEPDRESFEFRVKGKQDIVTGVPLIKMKNGEKYLFKTDNGIKAYNINDLIRVV